MTSTVRLAVADDAGAFMRLAEEYLREIVAFGSEILITDRTLAFWRGLFELYVSDDGPGVIVMAGDYAFTAAGNLGPSPYDTSFGECAQGWGTYVKPEHRGNRTADALRAMARETLIAKGFQTLVGGVHIRNVSGQASAQRAGFEPLQVMGYARLQQPEREVG